MKKFDALVCKPGPNAEHRGRQLEEHRPRVHRRRLPRGTTPTIQTVSCDAGGNKYVLGPAVVQGTELTSVDAALDTSNDQWVVNITLNGAGHRRRSAR